MKQIELFAGIGGFGLAGHWAGIETVCQVEIDPFCQKVLAKNFPNAHRHADIKTFDGRPWRGIDIVSGGFPCQPYSLAGKRAGNDDDRALWPEMLRVIREVAPTWVVGENVAGLISMDGGRVFDFIVTDLENAGYSVETFIVPAVGVGAPHKRDRVWIVAHAIERPRFGSVTRANQQRGQNTPSDADDDRENSPATHTCSQSTGLEKSDAFGQERQPSRTPQPKMVRRRNRAFDAKGVGAGFGLIATTSNTNSTRLEKRKGQSGNDGPHLPPPVGNPWSEHWLQVATRICRVDDGLPGRVDGIGGIYSSDPHKKGKGGKSHRLKALGNSIVPEVARQFFLAIQAFTRRAA